MSGIYIHIPFCKQACHYCDFHFSTNLRKKEQMLAAITKEIVLRKNEFSDERIETIYFGGGTPSILEVHEIEEIIASAKSNFDIIDDAEITLEANPDDLLSVRDVTLSAVEGASRTIYQQYKNIGINRLSIGVQSFFDEDLKLMNRAHNAIESEHCIREAKNHFGNISIDLIYGIPGMDDTRWQANIDRALSLDLPHISSYALTVEPKTALQKFIKKGVIDNVDDEQAERQFHILLDVLEPKGYVNYEISNFGKPNFFSKNNTSYWQQKKYLGIGPSAHSFDGQRRAWNIRNNSKYIKFIEKGELPIEFEQLTTTDKFNEYVMTGLRTIWGVSLENIKRNFGIHYCEYLEMQSSKYTQQNLLFWDGDTLLATKKGKFLVDGIASDLFMLNLKN